MKTEMEAKVLRLVLKREWFDMIASGEKREEYRTINPYWAKRLLAEEMTIQQWQEVWLYYAIWNWETDWVFPDDLIRKFGDKKFDAVTFYMGYEKNRPSVTLRWQGCEIGKGRPEWGADPDKHYFVIKLGEIL